MEFMGSRRKFGSPLFLLTNSLRDKLMIEIDEQFTHRLEQVFGGRLRARWSHKTNSVHIEQKVGRMIQLDRWVSAVDDQAIRMRDGYHYILEVQPGDRMPCPQCKHTLKVPALQFRAIECDWCKLMGKEHRVVAAYFPLGEVLIDHLKRIDPLTGASKQLRLEVNKGNEWVLKGQQRHLSNVVEDAGKDQFEKIAGIQSVGYTKNTGSMWVRGE